MNAPSSPRLDDLGFAELRDAAIQRIPAESAGQWTHHAPIDPGITILETLAYLLDQRLYWLDQVPAAAWRGILRLLGEALEPSHAATTVLRIDETKAGATGEVPAGMTMSLAASDPPVIFSTAARVLALPVGQIGVLTDEGVDRSADLASGRGVELMPADGGAAETRLVLHLRSTPAPAPGGARAALMLRLATAKLGPQWLAEPADSAPPPARIEWCYRRTGSAEPVPFAAGAVIDGTGGLRRSGIVRFAPPPDWDADGSAAADGTTPYSLVARTTAATFTAPPRLLEAVPNVVVAHHRERVRAAEAALERQVAEWLPLPGLELDCDAGGLLIEQPRSVRVSLRERDGRWHRWRATGDLAFHGPADRVFTVDRDAGVLHFGDGLTGRLPVPHSMAPRARVSFERGGGPTGNVGGGVSWEAVDAALTARSAVEASGGREPETLDAARERVAASLARCERAVTAADHETLAESTPSVEIARAHAAVGFHPGHPCTPVAGAVTVFVVPDVARDPSRPEALATAPQADPGALAAVGRHLEAARLLGSELFVLPARYRRVRIALTVGSAVPGDDLRRALERDLRAYVHPLTGGDEGDGWPFGDPVRPSALLRRAQAAAGGGVAIVSVAIGLDDNAPAESCRDLEIGPHDLLAAESVEILGATSDAGDGGLR
jgi:predicted phage baseplate assembly protein